MSILAKYPVLHLAGLSDVEIERADLVVLNLTVAREIAGLQELDIARYVQIVSNWTQQFQAQLPRFEKMFAATPWKWKSDIRFFRFGMLQGFLGNEIGIRYIEEQKHVRSVRYTDPGQLFLHGLIDTRQGTCGNMAALHVAMCRRLGWPVSLAAVRSHLISRYDDGDVIHNIEATSNHPGAFCSDPDEEYVRRLGLSKRAILCGSDLRRLTAREMLGIFLSLRGRHYADVGELLNADTSYALARVLFPNHRQTYLSSIRPVMVRGSELFDPDEQSCPASLAQHLAPSFAPLFSPCSLNYGVDVQFVAPDHETTSSAGIHLVNIAS